MIESIFILVGGTIGLWLLLVWELHRDVRALPITTNHCLYPENKSKGDGETQYPRPTVEALETSSSEIRIESDEEVQEPMEYEISKVVSTKEYRRRERVNTDEMEGDAGLEI